MKLYVKDEKNRRIYINKVASSRAELTTLIGKKEFIVKNRKYSINDVYAAKDSNDTITGLFIGGAIGAIGGPIGIALGGFAGAFIGNGRDSRKNKNVKQFNTSKRHGKK